jgi:hypothetical protein
MEVNNVSGTIMLVADIQAKRCRKIFLVEGIITTGVGLIVLAVFSIDRIKILSTEEHNLAISRIQRDKVGTDTVGPKEKTTWKLIWRSFSINVRVYNLPPF